MAKHKAPADHCPHHRPTRWNLAVSRAPSASPLLRFRSRQANRQQRSMTAKLHMTRTASLYPSGYRGLSRSRWHALKVVADSSCLPRCSVHGHSAFTSSCHTQWPSTKPRRIFAPTNGQQGGTWQVFRASSASCSGQVQASESTIEIMNVFFHFRKMHSKCSFMEIVSTFKCIFRKYCLVYASTPHSNTFLSKILRLMH